MFVYFDNQSSVINLIYWTIMVDKSIFKTIGETDISYIGC
jgi:hypothetical protein